MPSPCLKHKLLALSRDERPPVILEALLAWMAGKCGVCASAISPDKPFSHHRETWESEDVLCAELRPWVKQNFGFGGFYPNEIRGRSRPVQLADYLAREVEPPVPAPANFQHPDEGRVSHWPPIGAWAHAHRVTAPYVFLLGAPRSGTTLLRSMLDGHGHMHAPPELNLLPFDTLGQRRQAIRGTDRRWMEFGFIQELATLHGVSEEVAYTFLDRLADRNLLVSRAYELIFRAQDKALVIDKSPFYASDVAFLRRAEQMFDAPRYLFLTRHPHAVIESAVRMRFYRLGGLVEGDPPQCPPWEQAERLWARSNTNILTHLAEVPTARWHQLRYEDLVTDPEGTHRRICAFLDLEYDPAVATPYDGERDLGKLGDPNIAERNRVQAELADAWRKTADIYPLTGFSQQLAHKLGYEL